MTTLTTKTAEILAALRANVEGSTVTEDSGAQWRQVYLDNARPVWASARMFAGHLSALESAGLYRSQGDDCFGDVRLAA